LLHSSVLSAPISLHHAIGQSPERVSQQAETGRRVT